MKSGFVVAFSVSMALATTSQAQQSPPLPQAQRDMMPSITIPEALDRVLRDYERAWRAKDAAALAALFTPDGFVLQPGRPPVRGRSALEEVYRSQGGGSLRLRALAYAEADTVAYVIGAYGYGNSSADQGKFTLTFRRAPGGRWFIASDMDNSSQTSR